MVPFFIISFKCISILIHCSGGLFFIIKGIIFFAKIILNDMNFGAKQYYIFPVCSIIHAKCPCNSFGISNRLLIRCIYRRKPFCQKMLSVIQTRDHTGQQPESESESGALLHKRLYSFSIAVSIFTVILLFFILFSRKKSCEHLVLTTFLMDQSLFYKIYKTLRRRNFYHRSK